MATIVLDQDRLVVHLTVWEKVEATHGDLHIPLAAVRAVSIVNHPLDSPRGLRAPGTDVPDVVKAGTWRSSTEGVQFVVATRGERAVRIDLVKGQSAFDVLLIGVDDAEADAAAIRAAAGL
ncbi:hypothetical protein [Kitasatospora kifunensis]|uniref:Uncharacterized protein n=1 Tax=Kitasatospora kifunensis TaxID=58351 RepID=A0A7W7R9F3_KITKI|nr:hypothetical protein [Kitasatospora kifunensis]MBB4927789.1 hypothetical protein [Kitasatospora kifunensis]